MDARLNLYGNPVGAKIQRYVNSAGKDVSDSTLPAATQELVKLRASQINGCGFCTDMHTKDAAHAGETSTRLNLIAAWREAKVFTGAERAALELTEQGTRIADAAGGVTDEAWANAAKHYDEDQLAALINAYNRMNVIIQQPAGDYQPGSVRITRSGALGRSSPSRTRPVHRHRTHTARSTRPWGKLRAQCRSKAAVGTCAIRPLKRLPAGQGGGRVTLG
jgi:AhpD family alkylhydroperoxidase